MGSGEEGTPAKGTPKTAPPATPPPASVMGQEVPVTPQHMYPQDWQSMAAAYYGGAPAAGTPPAAFFHPSSPAPHPFMWANPHMLAPYGASIPYPPMYNHAVYPAHPVPQGTAVAAVEMDGKSNDGKDRNSAKKSKNGSATANQAPGKSGDGGNTNDDLSQSGDSGDSGTDNTSNGDGEANPQGTTANGKRSYDKMVATGKPATNLNIGMDIWNTSTSGKERLNSMNISPPIAPTAMIGQNGAMPLTTQDERELKRQRRKQSNRESARRSRLRKQQECEDLAKKVDELSADNGTLRSEIDRLKEQCGKLESENAAIKDELVKITGSANAVLVEFDDNAKSSADHCADGEDGSLSHQGVKGSENQPNGATFLSSSNGNHDPSRN